MKKTPGFVSEWRNPRNLGTAPKGTRQSRCRAARAAGVGWKRWDSTSLQQSARGIPDCWAARAGRGVTVLSPYLSVVSKSCWV